MLTTYPEIRDRIYQLARQHGLRVDWTFASRSERRLVLYDAGQVPVARAAVPLRHIKQIQLTALVNSLEGVFGEGWMN